MHYQTKWTIEKTQFDEIKGRSIVLTEEKKSPEELEKELAFYQNQTKVLREKNRDLRNALLLAESQQSPEEAEETAQESLSDIRKIISDSKKQITEKLSQFKETLNETDITAESSVDSQITPIAKSTTQMDSTATKTSGAAEPISAEADVLLRQVDYLKQEVDRLEIFLEQSEMVNNRLQELLSKHNIDVSEITKAVEEASKSAVSPKAIQKSEPVVAPVVTTPDVSTKIETKIEPQATPKTEPEIKELDPTIVKMFNDFKAKLEKRISDEDIKLEILNLREELMDLIPHSRVFYEMQVEYRKWKRGSSSKEELKEAISEWEKTIASM